MAFYRFVDSKENRDIIKQDKGFQKRARVLSPIRVALTFIIGFLICILLLVQLLHTLIFSPYGDAPKLDDIAQNLGFITFCSLAVGILAIYVIRELRETLHATEFLSLLFSGCMRIDSDFCIIVHKSGRGVYSDYNFSKMMILSPVLSKDPYQQLLGSSGLKKADAQKLNKALTSGKKIEVPYIYEASHSKGSKPQKLRVVAEPISRPNGFMLLRGYKK